MNTLAAVKIAAGLLDRQLEMFPKCPDDHVYIRVHFKKSLKWVQTRQYKIST